MARKNSPALFEVIRNAQQKQKEQLERQARLKEAADAKAAGATGESPASALLWSPKYWLGKVTQESGVEKPVDRSVQLHAAHTAIAESAVADMPAVVKKTQPAAPVRPVYREAEAAPVAESPAAGPAAVASPSVVTPAANAPSYAAAFASPVQRPATAYESPGTIAARQMREELSAQEAPAAEPMFGGPTYNPSDYDTADDDAKPQPSIFNFQFTPTSISIAGFAIVTAFVVAYVIGTAGHSDKTIAKGQPQPNVLNVGPTAVAPTPTKPQVAVKPAPTPTPEDPSLASVQTSAESLQLETLGKPIPVPTNVKRVVGKQYLVLLSFPRKEDAQQLVKFLAQNGVPATAEQALPDYAKSWTSVVTTRDFHTKNNPAYDQYSAALKDLLRKYAGDSKFRKFNIDVYTWRTAK